MNKLPPLKSLEAFLVVGRTLSMQRAAVILHRSASAISYRIRDLESDLGVRLFERLSKSLRLTAAGEAYHDVVTAAFARIEAGSNELRSKGGIGQELKVFVVQPFAFNWIIPKLAQFYDRHPDIRLSLQARTSREYPITFPDDLKDSVQIRFGRGNWQGFHCELIAPCRSFPVCSPALGRSLKKPSDLARQAWLATDLYPQAWPDWLAEAGLSNMRPRELMQVDDTELKYQAATYGLGVAMGIDVLVGQLLKSGALVAPFSVSHEMEDSYYLVCHPEAAGKPQIRAFATWLQQSVSQSAHRSRPARSSRRN